LFDEILLRFQVWLKALNLEFQEYLFNTAQQVKRMGHGLSRYIHMIKPPDFMPVFRFISGWLFMLFSLFIQEKLTSS
jgi:hypothetical protein